jgi:DNA polymerase I-like protein with 3'-5' exonuclease and polymerase domains
VSINYIEDNNGIDKLSSWLQGRKFFTWDLETQPAPGWENDKSAGLDPFKGLITLILVGSQSDTFIIDNRVKLDLTPVIKAVENPEVVKIGLNLKFDCKFWMHHFKSIPWRLCDVMQAEQVIRAGLWAASEKATVGQIRKRTGMASLVKFYFGQEIDKDKELRTSFWKTPVGQFSERQIAYLDGDIKWPERIARQQREVIKARKMEEVIRLEYDLVPVLAAMELEGMPLDTDLWLDLYQHSVSEVTEFQNKLDKFLGLKSMSQEDLFGESKTIRRINYDSPKQLAKELTKRGYQGFIDEKGQPTTSSQEILLAKLNNILPAELADLLIGLRKADQRKSSYGLNFIGAIHPVTKKIHPDFTQNCLVTGRISSSPGVQTIPTIEVVPGISVKRPYRAAFRAGEGMMLSIEDASQIEARISTDMTRDPIAVKTFQKGLDIYKTDGELMYNTTIDKNTPEGKAIRNNAKVSWLGLSYGQGKPKFHRYVQLFFKKLVPRADTDFLFDKWFEIHPVLREVMDEWSKLADPEESERYFYDDLATEIIVPAHSWDSVYDAMLRKSKNDKRKAELRAKRLFANRSQVRYSEAYAGRKRFFRSDFLAFWNAARNAPVQGGAATIQKESLIRIQHWIWENKYDAGIPNAVHDEILVRGKESQIEEIAYHHRRLMVEVGQKYLQVVPMRVEGVTSPFWIKPD